VDQDLDPELYRLYAETAVNEVAKSEGLRNSEQDENVRDRLAQLMKKFAHIRTEALG